jgi:hypothetical protein
MFGSCNSVEIFLLLRTHISSIWTCFLVFNLLSVSWLWSIVWWSSNYSFLPWSIVESSNSSFSQNGRLLFGWFVTGCLRCVQCSISLSGYFTLCCCHAPRYTSYKVHIFAYPAIELICLASSYMWWSYLFSTSGPWCQALHCDRSTGITSVWYRRWWTSCLCRSSNETASSIAALFRICWIKAATLGGK